MSQENNSQETFYTEDLDREEDCRRITATVSDRIKSLTSNPLPIKKKKRKATKSNIMIERSLL